MYAVINFRQFVAGAILVFGVGAQTLAGQEAVLDTLMSRFRQLDIAYFEDEESEWAAHPFFKAMHARIRGDETAYIRNLETSIKQSQSEETAQRYARILYKAYAYNRKREQALALNERYDLGYGRKTPLDLKATDFPAPGVEMEGNQVSVPFDQFYFDAVLNEKDTVRVFFDTGAPGISVSQELVEKYGWPMDTSYFGFSSLPAFGIKFKTFPTLIPAIEIGGMRLTNLFAKYGTPTEEEQERMRSSGVEDHDILMGLNAFDELIDGVAFDFRDSLLHFTKTLPEKEAPMNFFFVEGKPAVRLTIGGTQHNAFLDTGSPRHVAPKAVIQAGAATFNREANYGSLTYKIYDLQYDQVLNLEQVSLETADYGFTWSKDYNIDVLLGSFLGWELYYDLRNRIVTLRE